MEQRVRVVILASLGSLGCVIHPCATVAWWGGILTAKGQTIDIVQRHGRHQSEADVEQTAILRKISSLQFLSVVETEQTSSKTFYVITDSNRTRSYHIFLLAFCIIIQILLNMLLGFTGVKRIKNWLHIIPLIWASWAHVRQVCRVIFGHFGALVKYQH